MKRFDNPILGAQTLVNLEVLNIERIDGADLYELGERLSALLQKITDEAKRREPVAH